MQEPLPLHRRLVLSLLLAFFVLACVESMLQVFYYATAGDFLFNRAQPALFEEDEHRCYRLKPGLEYQHATNEFSVTIHTNAQGFRTGPAREVIPYERRPGVTRVMFLGPSFTYGWGNEFEDTYVARIVEGLRSRGHEVELLNLGTPAQGTAHQLCWLVREGYRYAPDLVVQTDYGDIGAFEPACREDVACPVIDAGSLYLKRPTLRTRLTAAVKSLGLVFYGYYLYHAFDRAPAPNGDGAGKELHGANVGREAPSAAEAAANYERYVGFVKGVLGHETEVAFVYLPLSYVVHPADAGRWWSRGKVDPLGDRRRIREAVAAIEGRGGVVVDPTTELVEQAGSERMYYWLDIHLTPAGNRVVADVAVPELARLLEGRAATR